MKLLTDHPKTAIAVMAAVTLAAALAALCLGHYGVTPLQVAGTLLPVSLTDTEIPRTVQTIILNVRLPRVLLALLAGAGLAVSGAAFQAMFANPLAAPDTLGVATGSAFGAVLGILLGLSGAGIQLMSLLAGLAAVALVLLISRSRTGETGSVLMIVLAGLVVGALFSALIALVKYAADPQDVLPSVTFWMMGAMSGATREGVLTGTPMILAGIAILCALRWRLNIITLPADEAASLGIPVARLRLAVIVAATMVTASAVSLCGLIGWVGLLVPHAARMLLGADNRSVIPASAVLGALFLLVVDTVARTVLTAEIPVSILTALIGAPFFILLLRRTGGLSR